MIYNKSLKLMYRLSIFIEIFIEMLLKIKKKVRLSVSNLLFLVLKCLHLRAVFLTIRPFINIVLVIPSHSKRERRIQFVNV